MDRSVRFFMLVFMAVAWAIFSTLRRAVRVAYQRPEVFGATDDSMLDSVFNQIENEGGAPNQVAVRVAKDLEGRLRMAGSLPIEVVDKEYDLTGHGGGALAMLIKARYVVIANGRVVYSGHVGGGSTPAEAS